jgi:hypothetical protein
LFVNNAELYTLVEKEIQSTLNKKYLSSTSSSANAAANGNGNGNGSSLKHSAQYQQELADARGRYRYKYERIVLKSFHFKQPWFRMNLDRNGANELFHRSGLENGKFLVRSTPNHASQLHQQQNNYSTHQNPNTNSSTGNNNNNSSSNSYNGSGTTSVATAAQQSYKISLCYNSEIKHYKIKYSQHSDEVGKYSLEGGIEFDSIVQLVDYYHRCSDGLVDILRMPLIMLNRACVELPFTLSLLNNNNNNNNNGNSNSGGGNNMNRSSNNTNGTVVNAISKQTLLVQQQISGQQSSINHHHSNQHHHHHNHHQQQQQQQHHTYNQQQLLLYDSNKMYDAIVNNPRNGGNNSGNQMQHLPLYVDDEPISPNDVTDLKNIPETKRALFEEQDNYEYESLSHYQVELKNLTFYDKLGSGCFGSVSRGTYKYKDSNGRVQELPVAIKTLNLDTDDAKDEILKEANIMKSLNFPHIIKFIGMCYNNSNGSLMIVLELAKLGPLHKYLRIHKEMDISKIVVLCYQVALAMEYLSFKNLVHRDLAARNVLLVSEELAKVSDFGMSRKMNESLYYVSSAQGKWPLKWYPPEASTTGKFDEKSDVWSFGVTCWEATSYGGRPYQGIDINILIAKLENNYRLEKPQKCPDELYTLMYKCWHSDRLKRPSFGEIVRDMRKIIYTLYRKNV